MIDKKKLGLTLAIFFAFLHALWAVLVAAGIAQAYIDWIFPLHFVSIAYSIVAFSLVNALLLIVVTFIAGYLMGMVLGAIWNKVSKGRR